jgi:hypothetical protein
VKESILKPQESWQDDTRLIAASSLILFIFLLLFYREELGLVSKERLVIGQGTSSEEPVRIRYGDSLRWEAQEPDFLIHLDDTLTTGDQSGAEIDVYDGPKLKLGPKTMIRFIARGDTVGVDLLSGWIDGWGSDEWFLFDSTLLDFRPDTIKPLPWDERWITEVEDLILRVASTPVARLLPVDPTPLKPTGPFDRAGYFRLLIRQPDPTRVQSVIQSKWVPFVWTPIGAPGAVYRVEVARDNAFGTFAKFSARSNEVMVQIDTVGFHVFRVRGTLKGEEIISEEYELDVKPRAGRN